jgi:hypothetical protein
LSITKPNALSLHAVWFALALALCGALAAFGGPIVEGQNAWIKPAKFTLSFAVHLATLALIAKWTGVETFLFRWSAAAVIATAWLEFLLIALQAGRGVRSHFNVETPFDAAVFTLMGIGVGVLFLASVAIAVSVWFAKSENSWAATVSAAAIFAGALGSLTAMAMVIPTPEQVAGFEQGIRMSSGGRYPQGVMPHGPAVPLLGWSLEHGDWRIAHFLGVHALQVLLLWGWLLRGLAPAVRNISLAVAIAGYGTIVVIAMWLARVNVGPLTMPEEAAALLALCAAAPIAAALVSWSVAGSNRT